MQLAIHVCNLAGLHREPADRRGDGDTWYASLLVGANATAAFVSFEIDSELLPKDKPIGHGYFFSPNLLFLVPNEPPTPVHFFADDKSESTPMTLTAEELAAAIRVRTLWDTYI